MSQPGHNLHSYNPETNQRHYTGRDLVSYRCQHRNCNQIDQYQYLRHDLHPYVSRRTYITSNTVIKTELQSAELYFVVLVLVLFCIRNGL